MGSTVSWATVKEGNYETSWISPDSRNLRVNKSTLHLGRLIWARISPKIIKELKKKPQKKTQTKHTKQEKQHKAMWSQ